MKISEISIDRVTINESSLNRLAQHINRPETKSWAIMTSWRADKNRNENMNNFKTLTLEIRRLGLGFIKLEGYGQEEDEVGNVQSVKEPSLFIPNISLDDAKRFMKKYNQFGIIYSGQEVDGKIMLLMKDGSKDDLGVFVPHKISQFYSTVKGKPFVFESIDDSNVIN